MVPKLSKIESRPCYGKRGNNYYPIILLSSHRFIIDTIVDCSTLRFRKVYIYSFMYRSHDYYFPHVLYTHLRGSDVLVICTNILTRLIREVINLTRVLFIPLQRFGHQKFEAQPQRKELRYTSGSYTLERRLAYIVIIIYNYINNNL